MNKDIIEVLKTINYPGYNRDIVSFGIVQDIVISGNSVVLKLNIQADQTIIDRLQNDLHLMP